MRLPIDTPRLQFLVVAAAEPLKQFEEDKPRESWAARVDTNGEVLWRVQLVALGDGEAEIILVSLRGDPAVKQGEMVRVDGMTAQPWEMGGRYRAGHRTATCWATTRRRTCGFRRWTPSRATESRHLQSSRTCSPQ